MYEELFDLSWLPTPMSAVYLDYEEDMLFEEWLPGEDGVYYPSFVDDGWYIARYNEERFDDGNFKYNQKHHK